MDLSKAFDAFLFNPFSLFSHTHPILVDLNRSYGPTSPCLLVNVILHTSYILQKIKKGQKGKQIISYAYVTVKTITTLRKARQIQRGLNHGDA